MGQPAQITVGDLRRATLAARERTGDKAIGTSVKQGLIRVERITYAKNGVSTVAPLSDYLPAADSIAFLSELGAS
jgi:hypothetical protein